jgi:hypothetical protein
MAGQKREARPLPEYPGHPRLALSSDQGRKTSMPGTGPGMTFFSFYCAV